MDPANFRGFTPTPPHGSDALFNTHSASLSSSSRSFSTHSSPFIEKPSPSPGLYHSSFSPPMPLTSYQGAFDPFGSDNISGSGPVRFQSGSFQPGSKDDIQSPWSHRLQMQTSSLSGNTTPDRSQAISSPDYPASALTNTSPPQYFFPLQRRSSLDLTPSQPNCRVNIGTPPFEQKPVTSFPGQNLFEHQHRQPSSPQASGSAVDLDFPGRDVLRGLGITGLNRNRDKRPGIIDDRSLDPSPVCNNLYISDGLSNVSDKQNEVC